MPANIIDINDLNLSFPTYLILDASVLLGGFLPSTQTSKHSVAVNFLKRLQMQVSYENTMALLPLLAYEECLFKIISIEIEANPINGNHWHQKYKKNPQVISNTQTSVIKFNKFLQSFPISIIEPEDLVDSNNSNSIELNIRMNQFIYLYNILPKDATILSSADRLGITHIASLDKDFSRANGFTIYLPT